VKPYVAELTSMTQKFEQYRYELTGPVREQSTPHCVQCIPALGYQSPDPGTNHPMLKKLTLLWDFTRPHTIIGSFLSITTLFLLACKGENALSYWPVYAWTLLAALGCNVFITGLNQITDREMDKINKPFLPIPAGRLSLRGGLANHYSRYRRLPPGRLAGF
jgi:homogentisate phytyltransferase / homogentisate geranylgeranyltransferase